MTKRYELSTLETWISTVIPDLMSTQPINLERLKSEVDWLVTESYRIQRSLQTSFHELKPKHAEQYIYMNQMDILRIMDIVEDYISVADHRQIESLLRFYQDVYGNLEKILLHMVKYFPCAINENLPMPKRYTLHEKEKLRPEFDQLLKLYDHPQVPKPLLDVAIRPLKEFFQRDNISFTFHKLIYFRFFIHEFLPFVDNKLQLRTANDSKIANIPLITLDTEVESMAQDINKDYQSESDINMLIHHKLHYINFNNLEYRNYCTSQLHDKLEAIPTQEEKIKRVKWYVTTERRQNPKPGMSLEPGLPPISEQILHIIEEEYKFLIEQNTIATSKIDNTKILSGNKIKLSLTSFELAQFAAVFEESGLIQAKVVDIISHIARNCTTEGGDDLQESSLRTQFYSRNNASALRKLSKVLLTVLDVIETKLNKQALTLLWVITGNSLLAVILLSVS